MYTGDFIDVHVHIGPEIIPRKYTTKTIIDQERGKIGGMVLKNHFYPTVPLIESEEETGMVLIGSITLNNYVGGLNADAIYASAKLSPRPIVVWFPTSNAENFLGKSKDEIPPEWTDNRVQPRLSKEVKGIKICNDDGDLTEEAIRILEAIKDNNCVLATGHISWQEAEKLVIEAVKRNIRKIIVTHPIYEIIDMPIEKQKQLAEYRGVYIEHNYAMHYIDKIPIEKIAEQIRFVGPEKCIISSDMGQLTSPDPSEALRVFAALLEKEGISEEEIIMMGKTNPMKILEIDGREQQYL